ncbi:MAG: hypothetical protein JNK15_06125 [Planctomycetes bacterium]|nr:hypothetical protein [Planctomycetota bacterium]
MIYATMTMVAVLPALLTIPLDGRPLRLGVPLPATAVAQGLRLEGKGRLQWRRLPIGGEGADPVWVELALTGPPGVVKVFAGGAGPCPGDGPVLRREVLDESLPDARVHTRRWHFHDGSVHECVRRVFPAATVWCGEPFAAGEASTAWNDGYAHGADAWCRLGRDLAEASGVLPHAGGGGATTKALRAHLRTVWPQLLELPGLRGAGDHGRSGGVVTNGEFDTSLALLNGALGLGEPELLLRARRAAVHLVDRDLDGRTGLPFPHGPEHRTGVPEPGHVWLSGLLRVGLLTADDELLQAAGALAGALAASPPLGEGKQERLRDYAWPLLELEAWLAVQPDPVAARAADRLAVAIARRWDATRATFVFGEGEVEPGVYLERGWLLGGLLLPALRAHLVRRPNTQLAERVAACEAKLLQRIGSHGQGLPTHWQSTVGEVFAVHREERTAAAAFLLDALPSDDLARLLRRATVRAAVKEMPSPDDPDLATQLTLLMRCRWVWR